MMSQVLTWVDQVDWPAWLHPGFRGIYQIVPSHPRMWSSSAWSELGSPRGKEGMEESVPSAFKGRSRRHMSLLPTFHWWESSRLPHLAARETEKRGCPTLGIQVVTCELGLWLRPSHILQWSGHWTSISVWLVHYNTSRKTIELNAWNIMWLTVQIKRAFFLETKLLQRNENFLFSFFK